jgi:hypothetical protein
MEHCLIRLLVTPVLGLLCAPLAADAQRAGKVSRVGFPWVSPAMWPSAIEGFR